MIRGEIWWVDFGLPFGSEPGFKRPAVIMQDDAFNRSRISTVIIIPITTNLRLAEAPGNVLVEKGKVKLSKDSVVVVSQIATIDKRRLIEKIDKMDIEIMKEIEYGIKMILGILY